MRMTLVLGLVLALLAGCGGSEKKSDGKIVFSGSFGFVGSDQRLGLARINSDTTSDSTFNPNIDPNNPDTFRVLGLQADGKSSSTANLVMPMEILSR